ncbi:MAG: LysR family transcriptional regulator [Betaproteobacteria bacterium]
MNLRFLEAFVWIARLRSFKAAADKLCTTQAGISSRIATLEEQLGTRLFERDRRSVALTYQGSELLPLAERMLELQGRLRSAAGSGAEPSGVLRIGVMETVVHTWLPQLLPRFAQRYPRVTVELHSDITPRLRDELLRGRLDVAFTTEAVAEAGVENRALATLPMRWIAAPALALPPGTLRLADLLKVPILSFHRESVVYRHIVQAAQSVGLETGSLRINFFSSLAAMIELVKAGFGAAPLPVAVVQEEIARGDLLLLEAEPLLPPLPVVASQRVEPSTPLNDALIALAAATCEEFEARQTRGAPRPADPSLSLVTRKT